jgi:capsular exopolysaccharide synthesis family protein
VYSISNPNRLATRRIALFRGCIQQERTRIIGVSLCCLLLAACYEQFAEKVFPIRGSIEFQPDYLRGKSTSGGAGAADVGVELAKAVRSADILSAAVLRTDGLRFESLGTTDPVAALQSRLRVRVDRSTDRLEIGLDSPFPHQAAAAVNAVINSLLASLQAKAGPEKAMAIDPSMVTEVDAATPDVQPKGLPPALEISISACLGLIFGIVMALHRGISNQRVLSLGQIEEAIGLRTAGYWPLLSSQSSPAGRGLEAYIDPASEVAMRCHSLLFHVFGRNVRQKSGSLLITSPARGDGRSTVALNLAATLATTGVSVVLVDADIQSPVLHKLLERDSSRGLCDALQNPSAAHEFVRPTHVEHLHLLSCGQPSPATEAQFQGKAIGDVLSNLRKTYSYVILDSGPVLDNPFTGALASRCKATLLVVQGQQTKLASADQCRKKLNGLGVTKVLAVVNAPHRPAVQAVSNQSYYNIFNYGWVPEKNPSLAKELSAHLSV